MRIGILTLPLHTNYGGNIQAYALMTVLKRMGHEVWFIARQSNRTPAWRFALYIVRQTLLKAVGKSNVDVGPAIRKFRNLDADFRLVTTHTKKFIDDHIQPQTDVFTSTRALEKGIRKFDFDALIVGSDQVWRSQYANIEDYFLGFANGANLKRISYAASFGTDRWTLDQTRTGRCAKLLKTFDSISVREDSGVDLCRKIFGVEARQVLDPTMLLDASDYRELLGPDGFADNSKGSLLVYILGENAHKEDAAQSIAHRFGLRELRVNNVKTDDRTVPAEQRIAPPTDAWLSGFSSADMVFTDSFHGCVFSILFRKPFWVCIDEERGATRLHSLLNLFNLEDRLIIGASTFTEERFNTQIDWDSVYDILERERENSRDFLHRALQS